MFVRQAGEETPWFQVILYVHVNIPFSAIFLSLAQAGIVSFGTLSCGNDDPTVYTRVDAYLDWIEEKLRA